MKLQQTIKQKLNQQQLQNMTLLQMSAAELEYHLQSLAMENPLLEPEDGGLFGNAAEGVLPPDSAEWQDRFDDSGAASSGGADRAADPYYAAGCAGGFEATESLTHFLLEQLRRLKLDTRTASVANYLATCVDADGYIRIPTEALSMETGLDEQEIEQGLAIIRTLDPAGVGAMDLAGCLELQLLRMGQTSVALSVVRSYLPLLAKQHQRQIAKRLGVPVAEVFAAQALIKTLQPRPGAAFDAPQELVPYLSPDLVAEAEGNGFVVKSCRGERPYFRVNTDYQALLRNSDDPEARAYMREKLSQISSLRYALGQRGDTMLRCAQTIIDFQREFFRFGRLNPLRLSDVAETLGLHESTVSRAVRDKYIRYGNKVYPLKQFFQNASDSSDTGGFSRQAATDLLRGIIREETEPLSDQKLSERMQQLGCAISRRTVAKYRNIAGIPDADGRRE